MKKAKDSFLIHGIMNIVMHLPVLIATSFWGLLSQKTQPSNDQEKEGFIICSK